MITVTFYRRLRKWRWRVVAANHEKIGASTQGYHNKFDAITNFTQVTSRIPLGGYARLDDHESWKVVGL